MFGSAPDTGVSGYSPSGYGVHGYSPSGYGVYGLSISNIGVDGYSSSNIGVRGRSGSSYSVYGTSSSNIGVNGNSGSSYGVFGNSGSGPGVYGYSTSSYGVRGFNGALDQPAILGISQGANTGVQGYRGSAGTEPTAPAKTGVYGYAAQDSSAVGVRGASTIGRGGRFSGGKAQINLDPSTAVTHPSSGGAGDIFLDASKRLWLCKGGTNWALIA